MPQIFSHKIYKNCFLQAAGHIYCLLRAVAFQVWSHDLQLWASICHMVKPPLSIQTYSTEEKQNTEDKITSCSFSLLGLQTEHLAQRNRFIGKLEKAHTKLNNTVQNYVPMCGYLDGFHQPGSRHKTDSPKFVFLFKQKKEKQKALKMEPQMTASTRISGYKKPKKFRDHQFSSQP